MSQHLEVEIFRYDPETDSEPRFESYRVPAKPNQRVLDAIRHIYEHEAGDLAFQFACRTARCGTCSVQVNGRAVLACQERAKPKMRIEPLSPPFPVVRDLVVERSVADDQLKRNELALDSSQGVVTAARHQPNGKERGLEQSRQPLAIALETAAKLELINSCINCQLCVTECPAVHLRDFEGPAIMAQLRRLDEHPLDQQDRVKRSVEGGLYECFSCDICTEVCPVEIPLADQIRLLRRDALFGQKEDSSGEGL